MVESAADLRRQVIVALDQVFPKYSRLFSAMFGERSKAFLKRCPTPDEAAAIDIRTLKSLLNKAGRGKIGREKPAEIKDVAKGSCGVTVAVDAFSLQIKLLARQIKFVEAKRTRWRRG